jgi:hypothetical protein
LSNAIRADNARIQANSRTNHVISSSFASESLSVSTHGMSYSQTPLQYKQAKPSYTGNAAQNVRLDGISIYQWSGERCNWPRCGITFQDSTRLSRHKRNVYSAPDKRTCEFCHARITGEDSLARHYQRHIEQTDRSRLEYYNEARDKLIGKSSK